jgi:L-ascorbate metabolism protein UlaG (beta-lactamase superfamily)
MGRRGSSLGFESAKTFVALKDLNAMRDLNLRSLQPRKLRKRRWLWVGLWMLLPMLAFVAVAAYFVLRLPPFGGHLAGDSLARAQANPQFVAGKFVNPLPPAGYKASDVWNLIKGQFLGDEVRVPPKPLPYVSVLPETLKATSASPHLRAFWIGHASVFIELDGVRLLVDPMFSDHASPFKIGPKRFDPPPIALADVPAIDAVLITHDHYDHLDMKTAQHLAAKGTPFFVPLGIGAHLQKWGVPAAQIVEFEWWQEVALKGLRVVSTPTRHYSGRGLTDANATLWTSWSVIGARHRFFVSGDTGYSDHFAQIGSKFGPFDLSFIKIGAYGPGAPWLDIHMSAEDAVRAHADVRAKRLFPVHWATFNLAFHAWDEPIQRAVAAGRSSQQTVLTPRLGEMVDADLPLPFNAWWQAVR